MSLLEYCCPQCGHSISTNNDSCVWCGFPIDHDNVETLTAMHEEHYDLAKASTSPEELRALAKDKSLIVRGAVGRNPNTPEDVLLLLVESIREEDRAFVLEDPDSCHPVRARAFSYAKDEYQGVLRDVVANPNVPPESLRLLAEDENLASAAAKNPNAPVDLLRELSESASFGVRWKVAENPSTPEDALRTLAADPEGKVRMGVAKNPIAPADLLRSLADDNDYDVVSYVASNKNTPTDVLEMLMSKGSSWVRTVAESNLQSRSMPNV